MSNKSIKGKFQKAKIRNEEGSMNLELPKLTEEYIKRLPNVSIVTITKDRGMFISNMLYNWINIKYPREKLEWLILDDSEDKTYNLRDYLPEDDKYINYIKLDEILTIADKRNKAVELSKYDYIVHMDDDDYYFPDHVLIKMVLLDQYKVNGIHSIPIGVYDMMERSSYILKTGTDIYDINDVAEGSMGYKKSYWKRNKFMSKNKNGVGEGRSFINSNFNEWLNVDFFFNMISITHTKNVTGNNRRFINESLGEKGIGNFEDILPQGFKINLNNIRNILIKDYKKPKINYTNLDKINYKNKEVLK